MYKFEWDDSLSVGVDAIDEDHRDLIELINKLFEGIKTQASHNVLEEIFDSLDYYVRDHFTREEILMRKHQFPELEDHISLHQEFINELPKMKEKFLSAGSHEAALNVYQFLSDWLINHIIKEDLKYTQYIHNDKYRKTSKIQKIIQLFTKKFTIRMRLLTLTFIPIFVILMLVFITVKENYDEYLINKNVYQSSLSFMEMNRLANALQLERGLSVAYLTSNQDKHFKEKLLKERKKVHTYYDEYIQRIKKIYTDTKDIQRINTYNTQYKSIQSLRKDIDKHSPNVENILDTYTLLIQELLNHAHRLSLNISDKTLRSSLITLSALLYQKEEMGLKRAVGSEVLEMQDQSKFKKKFLEIDAKELTFRKIFLEQATSEQKSTFFKIKDKEIAALVKRYEDAIILQIIDKKRANVDTKLWFESMTRNIEQFKTFIDSEVKAIQEFSSNRTAQFTTVPMMWISIVAMLSLLFSYFVILLEKSIYHPIKKFSDLLVGLSKGERNIHFFEEHKKDEFGLLQDAYEALRIELLKSDRQEIKIIARDQKAANLESIAFIDPLTGALNRRKFDEVFNYELVRAKRYERNLSILIIDIDHFKSINDNYGHANGDLVLQNLVSICEESMRSLDYIFRFGGEEFIILLPETELYEAKYYAQRLCNEIEGKKIKLDNDNIVITVSIGISAYKFEDNNTETTKSILERADLALYTAKEGGRNRVEIKV